MNSTVLSVIVIIGILAIAAAVAINLFLNSDPFDVESNDDYDRD